MHLRDEPDGRFRRDPDTPGWLEIENPTSADFDIGRFHLSDRRSNDTPWMFPESTIVPNAGRLFVFASGSTVVDPRLDELGSPLEISGFTFADGNVVELVPGHRVVMVENIDAFTMRYGPNMPVAGRWTEQLSDQAELLTVTNRSKHRN